MPRSTGTGREATGRGAAGAGRTVRTPRRGLLVLESCHTTWAFDTEASCFRRVPRGLPIDATGAQAGWQPYTSLEIETDSDGFTVYLNEPRTRLLRSFRHSDPCPDCGTEATAEFRLDAIADADVGARSGRL